MHSQAGLSDAVTLPPAPAHRSSTVSVLNLVKYWDGWSVYKLLCVVHKRVPHNFVPGQDHNFLEPKVEGEDGAVFFRKLQKEASCDGQEERERARDERPLLSERTLRPGILLGTAAEPLPAERCLRAGAHHSQT